jgi:hypothetical protein
MALEERHECLEVSLDPLGMLEEQLEDVALESVRWRIQQDS